MNFTTMENLLQSHDLSALDDADIRDSAYTDFFTTVNKKMTYKITKNKFDIQNGTARITVHMKYIDGTNIYAATIQEYTRKIAVAAYAGKEMTQDDIQEMMFKALGFTKEQAYSQFGFLLDAFKYGVPPHAGLAYGLDRLVMWLTGEDSIRDVIAFPKVKDASCLMTQAPGPVDTLQLEELGIELSTPEEE